MKRIAAVVAVVTAVAVAAPIAAAGNDVARSKPQVSAQVVDIQVAKVQRAKIAVSLQRHLVQVAHANHVTVTRLRAR